jgi:hypothetical protein
MTSPATRFIALLQTHVELAWFRIAGPLGDGQPPVPPLVVWRYQRPQPALEGAIRKVVSNFQGRVSWLYEQQGRNWVLIPSRVAQVQQDRALPTDAAAIRVLSHEDPQFCSSAQSDLADLADEVAAIIGDNTEAEP